MRLMCLIQLILWSIHQEHLHLNTRCVCSHSALSHLTQIHPFLCFSVCSLHEHWKPPLRFLIPSADFRLKREGSSVHTLHFSSLPHGHYLFLFVSQKHLEALAAYQGFYQCSALNSYMAVSGSYHVGITKPQQRRDNEYTRNMLGNWQNMGRRKRRKPNEHHMQIWWGITGSTVS